MSARRPYVYDRVTAEIHRRAHGAAASLPPAEACEACGRAQYRCADGRVGVVHHHHSYEPAFWLDTIPLCLSCHRRVHCGSLAEPRTGRLYKGVLLPHGSTPRSEWAPRASGAPKPQPTVRLRPSNAELARLRRERCAPPVSLLLDTRATS